MRAQDTTASRSYHCSAIASTSSRSERPQDLQQQQSTHMHLLSQQQPSQLQQAPAGQLAEQQAPVPMRSPFLAAQHDDDADGTLGSFAGQLLEELQHCMPIMHPAAEGSSNSAHSTGWQRQQNHHRHQHRHLQQQQQQLLHQLRLSQSARLPAATASWLEYDGSDPANMHQSKQQHSEELYSDEFYSDPELDSAAEHMPAHHPTGNTAEVRALLETCLEEAAERARSQTMQSSGMYVLGSESSLCSTCSIGDGAQPSMTSSGAVAIDWEAMLRSELHEAGMAKADLEALTAGEGASSLQCTADWGADKDEVQSAPSTAAVQAAAPGQQPARPAAVLAAGVQDAL